VLRHADDQPERPPQYLALSYVWGDATVTKAIKVNDHAFQATTNLESALRTLSKPYADQDI
jgi:hypothetical protein